ncbi:MAG: LysR family transcriptional regulator [Rhizomicrobium sp.]
MLVRHLAYFVTLARERHFARAAEASNVAQPTLSAAIRKLEEDLEARLVIRNHHFVGLTPEGERVLAWGRQILTDYNSLREDLSRLRKGMVGTLRLGVIPAAMPSVSFLTARFCKDHPAADVEIQSLNSRAIQRGLDAFELDGGITYLENEPLENVRRIPLYREHYVFVTRREHPLAARRTVTWTEAAGEKLCLLSEDMQNRRIITNLLASIGVAISPPIVSNSFLGIYSHLQHGEWSSIVPHTFSYMFGGMRDLVAVDLVEPVHTQSIGLVLSNREPPSPMSNALLASVLEGDLGFTFSQPREA